MSFINWGQETPAQLEARLRAEREWQALVEQAVNLRRQRSGSPVVPVTGVGGSSNGGDDTSNDYVADGYVENYLR